jgi:hypothetical protein
MWDSDKFSFLLPGVEEEEEGPGLWGYMEEPTIRQFPFRQLHTSEWNFILLFYVWLKNQPVDTYPWSPLVQFYSASAVLMESSK